MGLFDFLLDDRARVRVRAAKTLPDGTAAKKHGRWREIAHGHKRSPRMKVPLKLNSIDQEHLQELYDAAGIARDELPYTPAYEAIVQGFQDRTFKNADAEQIYGAMLKYVRSSSNSATAAPDDVVSEDQLKQLRAVLSRHAVGGKILPYSDEFAIARAEFLKITQKELTDADFWRMVLRSQGNRRKPASAKRAKVAAAATPADEEDDGE
jgi:hypothetical protein